jgi:predicted flap endonuclease-1-like 5' DNA nuclease
MKRWIRRLVIFSLPSLAVLLAAALWWWLLRRRRERAALSSGGEARRPAPIALVLAPAVSEQPDDLRRIEGVGPKISAVLQGAGVTTYARLAAAQADDLRAILRQAGIRLADPTTWPEQAALAAAGEWDALTVLQAGLKGGRRL